MKDQKIIDPSSLKWGKKRILIAEDEMMNYLYLEEALRETEVMIVWCKNGLEVIDKIVKEKQKFDAVLMDIKMPKMNGYEATKQIKKFNSAIPVIIQTAFAMPDEREKGLIAGGDEYVEKPIRQNTLLTVLEKYLK